jgi:plasmid stabilization system protein ParE
VKRYRLSSEAQGDLIDIKQYLIREGALVSPGM